MQKERLSLAMISRLKFHFRLIPALFALGMGVRAAESNTAPAKSAPAASSAAARDKAKTDATKAKDEANAQRDRLIREYESLAKDLKDATEEQKKAILEKMKERKKEFEAAQSALHKQMRDEQRRQRQNPPSKR